MNSKKNTGLTPAAIRAMVNGDIENFIASSTPGGIEAQEARGQRELVASELLPKEINDWQICNKLKVDTHIEVYAKFGITVLGDHDNLFYKVQLPSGWKLSATGHSMHNDLLDDKGRKRAGIFYKASFYDRKAHINFCTRYNASYEPVAGWDATYEEQKASGDYGIIKDGETVIWRSEVIPCTRDSYGEATKVAQAKLDEMFPLWRDLLAYWNEA